MTIGRSNSNSAIQLEDSLPRAYRTLNFQRVDIDRRMAALPPNGAARDALWQELESVLDQLRDIVAALANTQAADLPELRVKAEILETLLRPDNDQSGLVVAEGQRSELTLSLIEDVKRLTAP